MPDAVEEAFRRRHPTLVRLAKNLNEHLTSCLSGELRIDRVSARAKDVDRFLTKARSTTDGVQKYDAPLTQIQDQIGARIVVFYSSDVDRVEAKIKRYLTAIEQKRMVPEIESEFGYFGHHSILALPTDIIDVDMDKSDIPMFFELQIKTLFQHAWSEANHDLAYKPGEKPLTSDQKRQVAFTSAQAWGADHIFDRLFSERHSERKEN